MTLSTLPYQKQNVASFITKHKNGTPKNCFEYLKFLAQAFIIINYNENVLTVTLIYLPISQQAFKAKKNQNKILECIFNYTQ